MAKSASEIRMDYYQAVRQAESLEQIANDLRKTANGEFQDCISDISNSWSGKNSDAYIQKCGRLKNDIVKSADNLERTADTIKRVARNIYNAEMRSLEIAKNRKY